MIDGEVNDAMRSVSVTVVEIGEKNICFESKTERKWIPIASYSSLEYDAIPSDWTVGQQTSVPIRKWNKY